MGHEIWDIGHSSRDGYMSFEKLGVVVVVGGGGGGGCSWIIT